MAGAQSFNKILLTTSNNQEYNILLQEISGQLYIGDNLVLTSANNAEALTSESQSDGTNKILLSDLPTTDPELDGQIWNESGVLKVSSVSAIAASIDTSSNITSISDADEGTVYFASDTDDLYLYSNNSWKIFESV
jgi:hypothetical protein